MYCPGDGPENQGGGEQDPAYARQLRLPPLPPPLDAESVRAERRRTFLTLGLCAAVLFVMVVAYVSFMTSIETAALSRSARNATPFGHAHYREQPHQTTEHQWPLQQMSRENASLTDF